MIESLELRRFLSGSVSGNVYQDLNVNGVRDGGEGRPIIALPRVFLDANANNQLDPGELRRNLDDDGHYHIANVPPGRYRLFVMRFAGTRMVNPDGYQVRVHDGEALHRTMPVIGPGTLHISAFTDTNGDGIRQPGEPRLTGSNLPRIFLDLNDNGTQESGEPPAHLDPKTGVVELRYVPAGPVRIRVRQDAFTFTTPRAFSTVVGQNQSSAKAFGVLP